jgi:hypothetical protein
LIDAAEMVRSTFRLSIETARIAPKNNSASPARVRGYVRLTNPEGADATNIQGLAGFIVPPGLRPHRVDPAMDRLTDGLQ